MNDSHALTTDPASPPWALDAEALLARVRSRRDGLDDAEAAARLREQGPNRLDDAPRVVALRLLARQFASPLVLILVLAAGVSLFLRDWVDAAIVLVVVFGSTLLGFTQEYRADHAVAALRERLALSCRVRRGGRVLRRPAQELVVGDVVELAAGNLVPADGVLLESRELMCAEAALTGESFPVDKHPGRAPPDAPPAARGNCVFLGTSVRSGTGTMVVTATGRATEVGAVAQHLLARRPPSEFEHGVAGFGTLLLRVMIVMVLLVVMFNTAQGRPAIESLLFAVALAVGLSPELLPAIVSVTLSHGAREMAAAGVLIRRLEAIENLGGIDILCTDKTGTLTAGRVELDAALDAAGERSGRVLALAALNARLETGLDNPLDRAIVAAADAAGLPSTVAAAVDELPYDFERKRLSVVVPCTDDPRQHELVTKGAFDNVLAVCTVWRAADGALQPLDAPARERLRARYRALGEAGYRVLGVATRRIAAKTAYTRDDEAALGFEGFLTFSDPPKPDARRTLDELAALQLHVKIVTGDNRHVAAHVAQQVGLEPRRLLAGAQIAALSDVALAHAARRVDVFAEVEPQQKARIVRALQRAGHAVGFLGDGINDAPALHAADVGVSVEGATDAARESADVVLLASDLGLLRQGVVRGRRAFANTWKYITITTSANFGNMLSMALAAPLLPFLPLAPKQILLNNFLSDLPSMAISSDAVDAEQLATPQRWRLAELRRFMLVFGLASSVFDVLTFAVLLLLFAAGAALFQSAWFVVSVLTELAVVLVLRTRRAAWASTPSPLLAWATVAVAVLALALPWSGPLAELLGFVPLPPALLAASLAIVALYVGATEWLKRFFFARVHPGRRGRARAARRPG